MLRIPSRPGRIALRPHEVKVGSNPIGDTPWREQASASRHRTAPRVTSPPVLPCPACRSKMARAASPAADYWGCNACGGRALTMGALRKALPRPAFEAIWTASTRPGDPGDRRCPLCASFMRTLPVPRAEAPLVIDTCQPCAMVWFDRGETEDAGAGAALEPPPVGSPPVAVTFDRDLPPPPAMDVSPRAFEGGWQDIPALLGLPVEIDQGVWNRPWTTWAVSAAILAVSVAAMITGLAPIVEKWGLVPAQALRHGGLDSIFSFFLHGGIWHLASNLYFLLIFGDNVEDVLRPVRYLLLLLLANLVGDLLYVAVAHGSTVPSIGASGGISGVLAYYALAFPRARVRTVTLIFFHPLAFTWSARTAFGFWVALQVLGAVLQSKDGSGVNSLAHLGGAAAGVGWWAYWRE